MLVYHLRHQPSLFLALSTILLPCIAFEDLEKTRIRTSQTAGPDPFLQRPAEIGPLYPGSWPQPLVLLVGGPTIGGSKSPTASNLGEIGWKSGSGAGGPSENRVLDDIAHVLLRLRRAHASAKTLLIPCLYKYEVLLSLVASLVADIRGRAGNATDRTFPRQFQTSALLDHLNIQHHASRSARQGASSKVRGALSSAP